MSCLKTVVAQLLLNFTVLVTILLFCKFENTNSFTAVISLISVKFKVSISKEYSLL